MAPTIDAGWSWVIMVASSINNAVIFGLMKSGGVFYVGLMREVGVSRSKAALCASLIYSLSCFLAPVTAYLCTRVEYKFLVFGGGLLAGVGTILAALIPISYTSVLVFYGIFSGVGFGFVLLPNVTIIHDYFDKHRAFAVGFSMAGAAVGAFTVPPVFEIVLLKYNLQTAILAVSAFILHICPCGLLFRPQKPATKIKTSKQKIETETSQEEKISFLNTDEKRQQTNVSFGNLVSTCCEKQFIFLLYSYIMFAIVWSSYFTFLQEYALIETSDSVTPIMAVSLISAMSVGDLVCRLIFGWISDRGWVKRQHAYTFFLAMSGILLINYTADAAYMSMMAISVCFGIFISGVIVLSTVVLYDHCGPKKFQLMFGVVSCVNGVVGILAAPTLAYIRELSGTYKTCFVIMGFCLISSSMLWIIDEICVKFLKVCTQPDKKKVVVRSC